MTTAEYLIAILAYGFFVTVIGVGLDWLFERRQK